MAEIAQVTMRVFLRPILSARRMASGRPTTILVLGTAVIREISFEVNNPVSGFVWALIAGRARAPPITAPSYPYPHLSVLRHSGRALVTPTNVQKHNDRKKEAKMRTGL